jgi:AcrR family transcriptional regulator
MTFIAGEVGGALGEHWSTRKLEIWTQLGAIFLREGFRSLTVGDLADRLSCSRRTLYSLAVSRDELVFGVVDHFYAGQEAAALAAAASGAGDPDVIVALLIDGTLSFSASEAFVSDVLATPATRKILNDFRLSSRIRLVEALTKGMSKGSLGFHDPDVVAELLEAVTERLGRLRKERGSDVDDAAARGILAGLVGRWLAP